MRGGLAGSAPLTASVLPRGVVLAPRFLGERRELRNGLVGEVLGPETRIGRASTSKITARATERGIWATALQGKHGKFDGPVMDRFTDP